MGRRSALRSPTGMANTIFRQEGNGLLIGAYEKGYEILGRGRHAARLRS